MSSSEAPLSNGDNPSRSAGYATDIAMGMGESPKLEQQFAHSEYANLKSQLGFASTSPNVLPESSYTPPRLRTTNHNFQNNHNITDNQSHTNTHTLDGHQNGASFIHHPKKFTEPTNNSSRQSHFVLNDAQTIYLQQLSDQLRLHNEAQASTILDLKIRVAVLEKELELLRKSKEAVCSSLAVVVEALTRGSQAVQSSNTSPPSMHQAEHAQHEVTNSGFQKDDHQKEEIEFLRQKNRYLSSELKSRHECRNRGKAQALSFDSGEEDVQPTQTSDTEQENQPRCDTKGSDDQTCVPVHLRVCMNRKASSFAALHATHPGSGSESLERPRMEESKIITKSKPDSNLGFKTVEELYEDSSDAGDEETQQRRKQREDYFNSPPSNIPGSRFDTTDYSTVSELASQRVGKPFLDCSNGGRGPKGVFGNGHAPAHLAQDIPLDDNLRENPFTSHRELNIAIRIHQDQCSRNGSVIRYPGIFRYGLQFKATEEDQNLFRTVLVTNLPKDIELVDVVTRVRGGGILCANLCNTLALIGSMSARIIFKREEVATAYVEFCAEHPLTFKSSGAQSDTCDAIVKLIDTSTFPQDHLFSSSRCILLPNFPKYFSIRELVLYISCNNEIRFNNLLTVWMDDQRGLHLEYADVLIAGSVFGMLSSKFGKYADLSPVRENDTCAGPLQELLSEPTLKRPLFPNATLQAEYSEGIMQNRQFIYQDQQRLPHQQHDAGYRQPNVNSSINSRILKTHESNDVICAGNAFSCNDDDTDCGENNQLRNSETKRPLTKSYERGSLKYFNKGFQSFSSTSDSDLENPSASRMELFSEVKAANVDSCKKFNKLVADRYHKYLEYKRPPPSMAGSIYANINPTIELNAKSTPITSIKEVGEGKRTETKAESSSDVELSNTSIDPLKLGLPFSSAVKSILPTSLSSFIPHYGKYTPPTLPTPIDAPPATFSPLYLSQVAVVNTSTPASNTPTTSVHLDGLQDVKTKEAPINAILIAETPTPSTTRTIIHRPFLTPNTSLKSVKIYTPKLSTDSNLNCDSGFKRKANPDEINIDDDSDE